MSNYKKLDKMYDEYADDEDISKREIKDGCSRFNLFFMLYIMFLIFGVINLIGIFESITMLNIMSQISKNSVIHYFKSLRKDPKDIQKFSVNDFNNNYNFYYLFFEDIKKDAFDFNLMMFFGFFGGILLNAIGFIWTTGIWLVINGIALVLIYIFSFFDYDIKDNTFPLLKIFAIISFWILLSIGTGGSALLSQYILVYINFKYNDKISKFNKKTQDSIEKNKEIYKSKRTKTNEISEARESLKKKNSSRNNTNKSGSQNNSSNSLFLICLATIIGYSLKYVINNFIMNKNEINLEQYMEISGCFNDTICFDNVLKDTNLSINNFTLFNKLTTSFYYERQNNFIFILFIYGGSMIISIILYSILIWIYTTDKSDNKKLFEKCCEKCCVDCCNKDSYKVCEVCGFSIYCENTNLNEYDSPSCCCCCYEYLKLSSCTCLNCLCMILYSFGYYLLNLLCKCFAEDEEFCGKCCKEYKKSICNFYNEDNYKKRNQCFCYCYETKRLQDYIYKYLTSDIQTKIFPYLIEYFILKLMTSAFEKQYLNFEGGNSYQNSDYINNSNLTSFIEIYTFQISSNNSLPSNDNVNNVDIKEYLFTFIVFVGTFICYFYFSVTFYIFSYFFKTNKKQKDLSEKILDGTHGILIFDGLFSLIFSSLYLSDSEHYFFKNRNFYLVPILMNKFYYFSLNYFCVSYENKEKKFDIVSGDTLISVYLFIWDIIISYLIEYSSLYNLYITQIVLSCLPALVIIGYIILYFIFVIFLCFSSEGSEKILSTICTCFFFLSLLCFGGCCLDSLFNEDNENDMAKGVNYKDCGCECSCCDDCCYFCFDLLDCLKCDNCKNGSIYYCECCSCCMCYDCCDCCYCCYCCGDRCEWCDCCSCCDSCC